MNEPGAGGQLSESACDVRTHEADLSSAGLRQMPAWFGWLCLAGAVLAIAAAGWKAWRDPKIHFLPPHPPAKWIIYPTPASGAGVWSAELRTRFVRTFVISSPLPSRATLSVSALEHFSAVLNGTPLKPGPENADKWKRRTDFEVSSLLRPGSNELRVDVACDSALPALWAKLEADQLLICSDTNWSSSLAGAVWRPVQIASQPLMTTPGNELFYARQSVNGLRSASFLIICGLVFVVVVAARSLRSTRYFARWRPAPLQFMILAALLWAVLWIHNAPRIPSSQGFDAEEHLKYVDYILTHHALPLANEGFEMYQPPLYYLVAAGALTLTHSSPASTAGLLTLRAISLLSGIAACGCAFMAARCVGGDSLKNQVAAPLFAALFPFMIYLSFYPTNEMFALALTAAGIAILVRIVTETDLSLKRHLWLGVVCGLALLAKTSAIILLPIMGVALPWNLWRRRHVNAKVLSQYVMLPIACCLLICGWHYGRVMAHFGNPFVTNTDLASGYRYWQQPGFATGSWYLPGLRVFEFPFFSSFHSFWDGVYSTLWGDGLWSGQTDVETRPAWNYQLMAGGYFLAIVPALCILAGLVRVVVRFVRVRAIHDFVLLSAFFLSTFLLFLFSLKVPTYSLCKAFYASGALVSAALFAAEGVGWLRQHGAWLRAPVLVLLGVWGTNNMAAFWIRTDGAQAGLVQVQFFSRANRHDLAVDAARSVLRNHPRDYPAAKWLCLELLSMNRTNEARQVATDTLSWAGTMADAHLCVGRVAVTEGQLNEGITRARKATELEPDYGLAWQARARWEARAGMFEQAANDFREGLRIKPTNRELHVGLAEALEKIGQHPEAKEQAEYASRLR